MSAEDQKGSALKRARRAVLSLDGVNLGDLGANHGAVVSANLLGQLAIAEETARLADEQRTSNLLEFCKVFAGSIEKIGEKSVRDVLYERLGVADPNQVPF